MMMSTDIPPCEGIGHYVVNLSQNLISKGHEITIIKRGGLDERKFDFDGIEVLELPYVPIYPFHIYAHSMAVNKFFSNMEKQFDLIHLHQPLVPIPKRSLPIISTIHSSMIGNASNIGDINDSFSLAFRAMAKTLTASILKKTNLHSKAVCTVSIPVAEELDRYFGFRDVKIIGNGVNIDVFYPGQHEGDYVLYVGRLSHGKGLMDLINAIAPVIKKDGIKLYLCGKGELEGELKKAVQKKGIANNVYFLGQLDHHMLAEIYREARIFVFPSHYEGLPTAVIEAMASGCPILASDIAGNIQLVKNEYNGMTFKKGSVEDLRDKLGILLANDTIGKKFGLNARKTVEEKYSWSSISDKYESIYKSYEAFHI